MIEALQQKLVELNVRRTEVDLAIRELPSLLTTAQSALQTTVDERARLVKLVEEFSKSGSGEKPPYEALGRANVALENARTACLAAESQVARQRPALTAELLRIDNEVAVTNRKLADARLRAAVAQFERVVRVNNLFPLSEEIRQLAKAAAVPLEERGPILDRRFLTIAGYPLNWQ